MDYPYLGNAWSFPLSHPHSPFSISLVALASVAHADRQDLRLSSTCHLPTTLRASPPGRQQEHRVLQGSSAQDNITV
ncbi:hypothetical protein E2C01_028244 [Portunus trituberculatus]|uniref:Uncharacterized protein n=1 Tax=Portunus trituberculatus TaxID=210409 RepID=A0A5B7EK50_PORTR|nr:hypothetical protein [Portunus trituberculatus]